MWSLPKQAHLWLPGYIAARLRARATGARPQPLHLLFCVADHFEPNNRNADAITQRTRVERWAREYPRLARQFRDADGYRPRHTFFIPAEAYDRDHIARLEPLVQDGLAEVEVHLHHENDTSANLRTRLTAFANDLSHRHGLLSRDADGRLAYGFIHGNWALDNSLRGGRHCGVNDELSALIETGCYADFTMPAIPHESQAAVVNAVYYAIDDPVRPASHRHGPLARSGCTTAAGAHLLMIPGPVSVRWPAPPHGFLPRIDTGAIDHANRPTLERFVRWMEAGVTVAGRPDWLLIKVHTHGAPERNAEVLLGAPMAEFHRAVSARFNDGIDYRLHYVSARELANIVHAAIDGHSGDPAQFRDYRYSRPRAAGSVAAVRTQDRHA